MKNYFFTFLAAFIISRLLTACANITPIEGGPKDTLSPTVKSMSPRNQTINYKGQVIMLRFNEKIETSKLRDEMQISPYYGKNLDIKNTGGYSVSITFKDSLKPNTTYIIKFNNGIKDLTEGNVPKDLQLVFSTGPSIDSLSLHGQIKDQYTAKAAENILIGLWKKSDTLNIKKQNPYYYTHTDKQGNYYLQNAHAGEYELYAIEDRNKNFEFNHRSEKLAFIGNTLILNKDSASKHIAIGLVKQNDDTLDINSISYKKDNCEINFTKAIDSITITASEKIYYTLDKDKKKTTIYSESNKLYTDSIKVNITTIDSMGVIANLSKNISFKKATETKEDKKDMKRDKADQDAEQKKKAIFSKSFKPADNDGIIFPENIEITFDKPVGKIVLSDTTFIKYDNKIEKITADQISFDQFRTKAIIKLSKANDSIIVKIPKATFLSVQEDTSAQFNAAYKILKEEDVALLEVKVTTEKQDYYIELLNSSNEVVQTRTNKGTLLFGELKPGEYQLRAIIDINKNRRWDAGNYHKRIVPEEIIYLEKKITLKQNWEVRDVNFSF